MSLRTHLQQFGVDLAMLIEQLDEPTVLMSAAGILLWQNEASVALFGDRRGEHFTAVAPEYLQQARTTFTKKMAGREAVGGSSLVVIDGEGNRRRVETVSISISRGKTVVGVLGIVKKILPSIPDRGDGSLTPRQEQTLRLLANGLSTEEIAHELGVARETARNYIRRLLQTLGVHSRLEAVVRAGEIGLL